MVFHHHLGTSQPKQLRILYAGIQHKCVWSWGVKSAASQFSPSFTKSGVQNPVQLCYSPSHWPITAKRKYLYSVDKHKPSNSLHWYACQSMPWTLRQLTCICSSFSANQIKLTNSLYVYAFQYLPPTFESAIHEQCKSHLTSFTHAHCYDNRTIGYQLCLWVQPSDIRFSHRSIDPALISISWFDIVHSCALLW